MGLLVIINLIKTIVNSQYFYQFALIGLRIRSALTSALFRKAFDVGPKGRKDITGQKKYLFSFAYRPNLLHKIKQTLTMNSIKLVLIST